MRHAARILASSLLVVACAAPTQPGDDVAPESAEESVARARPIPSSANRLTVAQRLRADRLVSVFENGTIEIQYDYVENIHDGRGYTIGRGFTTATGDAYRVVDEYVKGAPRDALARFLPELKRLADRESGSTSGLSGFASAWKAAAKTGAMRAAEDHEVDRASYLPATKMADALGLRTALGLVILYDTIVMHGDGTDPDGAATLVSRATSKAGGTPKSGVEEHAWLTAFVAVRRADLVHASDPATRKAWAEAVSRADVLRDLVVAKNDDLHGPITVGYDYGVTVP